MIASEYGTFAIALRRLSSALGRRLSKDESEELPRTFFRLLEPFELPDVLDAGKTLATTAHSFPKPTDWIEVITVQRRQRDSLALLPAPDRRQMSQDEAAELTRAKLLHFSAEPCGCPRCLVAQVDDRPLRFVPTVDDDGREDRALNPQTNAVELAGHWAHGDELARWYVARDACYALWRQAGPRTFPSVVSRDPGEEG